MRRKVKRQKRRSRRERSWMEIAWKTLQMAVAWRRTPSREMFRRRTLQMEVA